ncbi:alpha/beta fold hydrolase [Geotalea sp. SG265]|uniref:alpha/beta fold hydrolase n=1 Tax=Geotalea sp. SG265 TaxID=2922867 RepID=UPI001FAEEFB6|nr:alpha/beta fold hydrolase [Geotalea sp. SG265]
MQKRRAWVASLKARGLIVLLALVVLMGLSGCDKHSLFQSIMNHERESAKLTVKTETLPYGKITYLTNSVTGSEPPIVMLHGFGGEKDNWNRFSKKLTDDYRVIIPDLPGHGESVQDPALNYGIEEQTKRLKQFLDALGVKKAHLVGNSMGGAIALRYAYLYPQAVSSLALFDGAGAEQTATEFQTYMKTTGKNPLLEIETAKDFQATMAKYVFVDPPYIPGFIINVLVEEKLKRRALEKKMFADIMADLDQMSILSSIKSPALILWGGQDKILHVDNAELLHIKLVGSHKEVIDGVGHCPMIEKPEVAREAYLRFLHEMVPQGKPVTM